MRHRKSVQGRLRSAQRALARATPAQGVTYNLVWQTDEPGVYTDEAGQRVTGADLPGQVVTLEWGDEEE